MFHLLDSYSVPTAGVAFNIFSKKAVFNILPRFPVMRLQIQISY